MLQEINRNVILGSFLFRIKTQFSFYIENKMAVWKNKAPLLKIPTSPNRLYYLSDVKELGKNEIPSKSSELIKFINTVNYDPSEQPGIDDKKVMIVIQ